MRPPEDPACGEAALRARLDTELAESYVARLRALQGLSGKLPPEFWLDAELAAILTEFRRRARAITEARARYRARRYARAVGDREFR